MKKKLDLSGVWQAEAEDLGRFSVVLPGTLDTNGIGHAEEANLTTRLTRLHTYEGQVKYEKEVTIPDAKGKRLFLKIERTREVTLEIEEQRIEEFVRGTLSTPYLFEITKFAGKKVNLAIIVDNQYTEWPRESMIGASAVTDETQTNWNGILGEFGIYETTPVFFHSLRVYPSLDTAEVCVELDGITEEMRAHSVLVLSCEAFAEETGEKEAQCGYAVCEYHETKKLLKVKISGISWGENCRYWDEKEGNLYTLTAQLYVKETADTERRTENICPCGEDQVQNAPAQVIAWKANTRIQQAADDHTQILAEEHTVFGIRTFGVDDQLRLVLNGRRIFLRGEANCCVFPETGHPPLTQEEWEKVLERYASYGVNCMRFHSWCPPDAAFRAADRMGMLMQPELSQWNFQDAFGTLKARAYYQKEMYAVLQSLANHPSFVMLTFGNELQNAPEGEPFAGQLLREARAYDPTRLYANSSNYHYGEQGTDPDSDFYTAMGIGEDMLRAISSPMIGHLNQKYPSADTNYNQAAEKVLRDHKPCFGFEVGQYEVLPDFKEIDQFQGVTRAQNLVQIREHAEREGMLSDWERYVEATGELALLSYREEVEAVLRTEGMSGLSLLGLQDFPGQGTALVGMMNSHLEPKPYAFAKPERFSCFFHEVLPLLYLKKYTYQSEEELYAEFTLANYSKGEVCGTAGWEIYEEGQQGFPEIWPAGNGNLKERDGRICGKGTFSEKAYPNGGVASVGSVRSSFPPVETAKRLYIRIFIGKYENQYPVWVYPKRERLEPDGRTVIRKLSEELLMEIEQGAQVFLEPELTEENLPCSIGGQFTTDFWSVGTFPVQEGGMGMLIDKDHPVFQDFPTEMHSNYQWWAMAQGRPMILPKQIRPMITVPDSCIRLKHMGLLFEAALGKGKIMISSMGLFDKQQYPECRSLLHSLLTYMKQEGNRPESVISKEELRQLVPWNAE